MLKIFQFRYEVFCLEKRFFDKKDFTNLCETDEYDKIASHFAAVDDHGEIAGYLRLVHSVDADLPIEKLAPDQVKYCLDDFKPTLSEISRLAIKKKYRKHFDESCSTHIQIGLYKIVYQASKDLGLTHLCSIMEKPLFNSLTEFSINFKRIGPAFYNHGLAIFNYLSVLSNRKRSFYLKIGCQWYRPIHRQSVHNGRDGPLNGKSYSTIGRFVGYGRRHIIRYI